jgi:D-3-phosphoglycerate dehydrogenase
MSKFKVLLTDNIASEAVDVFSSSDGIETITVGTLEPVELVNLIGGFDAVIVRSPTKLTSEIISAGERLKFIGRAGVGTDNIDIEAAAERGITVMNAPGGNTISTAEHTVGMILALARRIPEADRSVRGENWDRKALRGVELDGKTLGVIGFGRVGREVVRRMLAFSMDILAYDPYVTDSETAAAGAKRVNMADLLARSDFITVHVALTPETKSLIADSEIETMKDGVFLVNCARGGVIDEVAVGRALESGKVAGIAFDVFSSEPPGDDPMFRHPRSIFTPHLGSATPEAQVRVAVEIAETIASALTGQGLRHVVKAVTG